MSNTATRPVVGTATGLVTFVDANGVAYPALVTADFAPPSGTGSATGGCVDLEFIDLNNPANKFQDQDLSIPTRGRKSLRANAVPDQGNVNGLTVNTATTATSATATVSSATGVPAAGFVTGPGIPAGTTYTLSGTTVTLSVPATATQAAAPLTFSATAQTAPYWRYPTAYAI